HVHGAPQRHQSVQPVPRALELPFGIVEIRQDQVGQAHPGIGSGSLSESKGMLQLLARFVILPTRDNAVTRARRSDEPSRLTRRNGEVPIAPQPDETRSPGRSGSRRFGLRCRRTAARVWPEAPPAWIPLHLIDPPPLLTRRAASA